MAIRQKDESQNQAHQIFRKTIISFLLIRTRTLHSCNQHFEIRPVLLPTNCRYHMNI